MPMTRSFECSRVVKKGCETTLVIPLKNDSPRFILVEASFGTLKFNISLN